MLGGLEMSTLQNLKFVWSNMNHTACGCGSYSSAGMSEKAHVKYPYIV